MSFLKYIIILPLLWWAFDVSAQVQEESSARPQQWELTLDIIKSKAQALMSENNGLKVESQQLIGKAQELQKSINDQQYNNEQMNSFLKERHGRTDQQLVIEQLKQSIETKRRQAKSLEEQLEVLNRRQARQERFDRSLPADGVPDNDQLTRLRDQLEDDNKQEAVLADELNGLKASGEARHLKENAIEAQNKELEARLGVLRLQKLQHEKMSSDMQASEHVYEKLKMRKAQLEENINAYESHLQGFKGSSLTTPSWPLRKKQLVHALVQADAGNQQIRNKIKALREDIDVLKGQVAGLERQVNIVQGKTAKP